MTTTRIEHNPPASNLGGYLLIMAAATLWGTTGTSQALAPQGVNPLSIGAMRIIIGGLALLTLALLRGGFRTWSHWPIGMTAVAAVSTAAYQATFFGGTYLTGVAVGTLVGIGSTPIIAGALGILFEGEKLTPRWLIATGLAIVGVGLLALSGNERMTVDPLGIALSLGAGLSYAIFTLANKRLLAHHSADEVMAVSFVLGALLISPVMFFVNTSWIVTQGGLVVVAHLGLIATGLSYALFGRGLRTVPVSTVGTLTLAEPLTAAILGIFIVGESVTAAGLVGVGLLFAGLVVLTIQPRKNA